MSELKVFNHEKLKNFCTDVLVNLEMPRKDAFIVADSLVSANLKGVDSHGVVRMGIYTERLIRKLVKSSGEIIVQKETESTALIDANNLMGQIASVSAMEIAMLKAEKSGVGFVGVYNSNHFGAAAYFSMKALDSGMIGFAYSNAPATMAPWGSKSRYFGTNPFSVAVPAENKLPIVLDMATSVTARGKIIMANQKGEKIDLGLAIDKNGVVTTNAKDALEGAVLPFGGAKGSGIALLVDILCGILTGANFGPHISDLYANLIDQQNVGHFVGAINPENFIGRDRFKLRMDQIIKEIKELPTAQGFNEVLMPGELEFRLEADRKENGVPLDVDVIEILSVLGRKFSIRWLEEKV